MSTETVVAQKAPYPVAVEAGKTHYGCACGCEQSGAKPLCDISRKKL